MSEIDVLRAAVAAEELTQARAVVSGSNAMIRPLQLHSAERHARLMEQLEMQLEDLETDLGQDRAKTDAAVAQTTVAAFERRRPTRKPPPEQLPREQVVVEAPASCTCCGSPRIVKMGARTSPRRWGSLPGSGR